MKLLPYCPEFFWGFGLIIAVLLINLTLYDDDGAKKRALQQTQLTMPWGGTVQPSNFIEMMMLRILYLLVALYVVSFVLYSMHVKNRLSKRWYDTLWDCPRKSYLLSW